jgi:hypothetical protein
MADSKIRGYSQIKDESIKEPALDCMNTPNDGEVLSWNAGASRFEWATGGGGGSGTPNTVAMWDSDGQLLVDSPVVASGEFTGSRVWVTPVGLGIGEVPDGDAALQMMQEGIHTNLFMYNYGNSKTTSIRGKSARGTKSQPEATRNGDLLMVFGGLGHNGESFPLNNQAAVQFSAAGDHTPTSAPTRIRFYTTSNLATSPDIRMTIDHDGKVGIGTDSPGALLTLVQPGAAAAVPVLSMNQYDLDQSFIRFAGQVGASNPIQTTALGTYYGRIRVEVGTNVKYIPLYNP